ncbi:MAG: NAD(P)/FAD-dependent oxidoreductase [Anaerolineales bacterium]|jgi:protoporphyrinogen oxidase
MGKEKNIAIIGAGFGGMAAAYDLVSSGHRVSIYEKEDFVGGLASGIKEPEWDWYVEKYYHHWFATDKHMLGLIEQLGWSDRVIFPRPYTVMYHEGKFYPFDSYLNALLYPGLGWGLNKIRFGLVGLYLRMTNDWKSLEKTTVDAWMRKWAGEQVYQSMWEPLVVGKFGKYHREVNMAWMWARLKARTTRLGTFIGGFQAFAELFAQRLVELGVEIKLETGVNEIVPQGDGSLMLETTDGVQAFDQCLVTVSPAFMARLVPALPDDYLGSLLKLKSMGAVVMILSLKQQLSVEGYYWYNIPKSAGFPFLALVEHTNYVSEENFGGDHILYCGDYLDPDHEYFQLTKEELIERFLPSLTRINPKFSPDWVKKAWLFRTKYAQPVPEINHSKNIPAIETPIKGLYFASMSQVYPWDRGTNFAVEIGRKAAGLMNAAGS